MKKITLFILFVLPTVFFGQTYVVDPTFNTGNTGVSGSLACMLRQADGKILIGGSFSAYNGVARNGIARLNADGTLDTTFNVGSGVADSQSGGAVLALAIDANGKILAGGTFSSYRGSSRNGIVRINDDGTIDQSFVGTNLFNAPPSGFIRIEDITVLLDGKILVGGNFRARNQTSRNFIRLNSDGSYDTGFVYPTNTFETDATVKDIEIQADGKILACASFSFNGLLRRFNADGTLDTTFQFPNFDLSVYDVFVAADGKIIVGGLMVNDAGDGGNILMRVNENGSIDSSFTTMPIVSGTSVNNAVYEIKSFNDKLLIGGNLNYENSAVRDRIVRIGADGTQDSTFSTGTGPNGTVYSIDVTDDNKILIAGSFYSVNGVNARGIARLADVDLSAPDFINDGFTLFYNNNQYFLHSNNTEIKSVELYDITGKKLHKSGDINCVDFSLNNSYAKGVKIFKIEFSNKSVRTVKVVN